MRRRLDASVNALNAFSNAPSVAARAARERPDGVTLHWPGRSYRPTPGGAPAAAATATRPRSRRVPFERYGAGSDRLCWGDALDVARMLLDEEKLEGKVDLVYIDPPFASQADYIHEARLDGTADGRVVRTLAYEDTWRQGRSRGDGVARYLDELAPRLELLTRLLAPGGTLWVHLDWRAAYLVRVLLEELLGRDAFINEIVWKRAPNLGRQAASHQFGRTLDTLLVYSSGASSRGGRAKLVPPTRLEPIDDKAIRVDAEGRPFTSAPRGDYTDASIARLDREGRVHRTPSGRLYVKYFLVKNADGVWCRERRVDALWTDVAPLRHAPPSERTGFPTQKPRALLERIIRCATQPGELVVDLFAGSGTTGEVAHALGRRFILGDAGAMAMTTARARLLRAGADLAIDRVGSPSAASADVPRVTLRRTSPGRLSVTLDSPREPAAWAIAVGALENGAPFVPVWHSERAPGKPPVPASQEATIAHARGPITIRVYGDDGSIATATLAVADKRRATRDARG